MTGAGLAHGARPMGADEQPPLEGDYTLVGPPGTGKTTWLAKQVKTINERLYSKLRLDPARQPVLIASLTKTAAAEIAGRGLDLKRQQVGTMHAHGYRALGCPVHAQTLAEDFNRKFPHYRVSTIGQGAAERAASDDIAAPVSAKLNGDALLEEYETERAKMTDRTAWPSRIARFAKAWEGFKADTGSVDFSDMIEHCLRDRVEPPGNPYVMIVDECQDFSRLEYALTRMWSEMCGAGISVGDPWQSIYAWRGADPQAMFHGVEEERVRVLHQSYRVPAQVHAASMRWVQGLSTYTPIDYRPRDEDGCVELCAGNYRMPHPTIDLAERDLADGKSVMFIATCAFHLDPLRAELKRRALPFANPWKVTRGDWNPLSPSAGTSIIDRMLAVLRPDDTGWTATELAAWGAVLQAKGIMRRGAKKALGEVCDQYDDEFRFDAEAADDYFEPEFLLPLVAALDAGDEKAAARMWHRELLATHRKRAEYPIQILAKRGAEVLRGARGWYEDPRSGAGQTIYVGTIHSFKGAEADVVYLMPDLSPAAGMQWMGKAEEKDAIYRAFYVALTRSRHTVRIMQPAGGQAVDPMRLLP